VTAQSIRFRPALLLGIASCFVVFGAQAKSKSSSDPALPEIHQITPSSGYTRGGQRIRISGTGFVSSMHVWIGQAPCDHVGLVSPTEIECVSGAHPSGTVSLLIQTPLGFFTQKNSFTYVPDLEIAPGYLVVTPGTKKKFQVSGGVPPYHFTLLSGNAQLDEKTGAISGSQTPDAGVVRVTDSRGGTSEASYHVPPQLHAFPDTIDMETDRPVTISGMGGEPPYSFELVKGGGKFYPDRRVYISPPSATKAVIRLSDSDENHVDIAVNVHLPPFPAPRTVAVGDDYSCAISGDATKCWGSNNHNQLGSATARTTSLAIPVESLKSGVQSIVAGLHHTCVLVNGGVKCWGDNQYGQLGNGTNASSSDPVNVIGLDSGVLAIAAGEFHTCASLSHQIVCWGRNDNGQLGNGAVDASWVPTLVSNVDGHILGLTGGAYHTCASVDGVAKCWGKNQNGQLGTGNQIDQYLPFDVAELGKNVGTISAGRAHTCAIAGDSLKCWGFNGIGNLGLNHAVSENKPFEVQLAGATNLASRQYHTCAVASGALYCWGYNYQGQVGDSSFLNRFAPVAVVGLPGAVKDVATGDYHTCATLTDGRIFCWGENYFGQLGDGDNSQHVTPVEVRDKKIRKSVQH
jgi:alpha-tubulin suppressor-like RCC1 family protein